MSQAGEAAADARTPLGAALAAGTENISYDQVVTFTKYVRLALPIDGYIFWVKADLVSESALFNAALLNGTPFNSPSAVTTAAKTFTVKGSLHYATDSRQEEQEAYGVNRVVFTALQEVNDLNDVGPFTLWIGEWEGLKFAFNARGLFYRQAELYHYIGNAVYADMETQLVDDVSTFAPSQIVSNSLPLWLAMNGYKAKPWEAFSNNQFTLFPSFLSPNNLTPPFGTVHIAPENTQAIASAPVLGSGLSHDQLVSDRVRITLWGVRNSGAMDFVDFVNQYCLATDTFGIMNVPTMRDEKRAQVELGTLAQKKTIEYQVSYLQSSMRNIARQLIQSAIPTFILAD